MNQNQPQQKPQNLNSEIYPASQKQIPKSNQSPKKSPKIFWTIFISCAVLVVIWLIILLIVAGIEERDIFH